MTRHFVKVAGRLPGWIFPARIPPVANEQFAFIDKAKVPSREAWQAAVDECGFDLQLDPEMKPMEDSAFSPCFLMGARTGVEIYYLDDPEFLNDTASINRGRNFCISFRWGGHMSEGACAMIASYALAKHFDAVVSYEGDEPMALDVLLEGARQIVEEARKGG
jgi:hypothetical protein